MQSRSPHQTVGEMAGVRVVVRVMGVGAEQGMAGMDMVAGETVGREMVEGERGAPAEGFIGVR